MANLKYFSVVHISLSKKTSYFSEEVVYTYVFIYLYKIYEKNKNKTKIFFQLNFLQEMSS